MPFRSSLARSAGKLLGVFKERDLSLRGATQSTRFITAISNITATGGTKNTSVGDGYIYHVFEQTAVGSPNSTTFQITTGYNTVEVLVIGGGAGAGSMNSGTPPSNPGANGGNPGGGGGGAAVGPVGTLGPGTYPLTVGAGGRARGATQLSRELIVKITATGGTKNTSVGDGYIYHVFEQTAVGSPNSTTFQITDGNNTVEVLVIGGGGGSGSMPSVAPAGSNGGNPGGGGGGAAVGPVGILGPGTYPLTVGAGGKGRGETSPGPPAYSPSNTFATAGEDGGTSVFNGVIQATGGAGGPANAASPLPGSRAPGGTGTGGVTNGTGGYGGYGVLPGSPGQGAGDPGQNGTNAAGGGAGGSDMQPAATGGDGTTSLLGPYGAGGGGGGAKDAGGGPATGGAGGSGMYAGGRGGAQGADALDGSGPATSKGLGGQNANFPPGGSRSNNGGGGGAYGGGGGGLSDMANNSTKSVSGSGGGGLVVVRYAV